MGKSEIEKRTQKANVVRYKQASLLKHNSISMEIKAKLEAY